MTMPLPTAPQDRTSTFRAAILRKAEESRETIHNFFEENAGRIEKLALEMAERFRSGARLFVMGNGGSACDAEHVSVEFMHPIFEKRRALPAVSLSNETALITAISNDTDFSKIFSTQLKQLGSGQDIAIAISTSGMSANLVLALKEARKIGMLTAAFSGKDGGRLNDEADFCLIVPAYSIHRIQEAHVVLLHIIWDLVHLALGEEDIV